MAENKLHADVKPFDHKPEKRGSDGKIISARYYNTHIVNGVSFVSYYDKPSEFYYDSGKAIPYEQVPEVCKLRSKVVVPKPNKDVVIKSSKSGESSDSGDSLI